MLLAILILILSAVLYTLYFLKTNKEYRRKLSKIKSDPALPIVGHVLKLGRKKEDLLPVLEQMWRKYGCDKFILKIGPRDQVVLTKPSDIEIILSSNEHVNKNTYYKSITDVLGDSIVTTDEHRWRILRVIWTPAFNYKCLEAYVDILRDEARVLLKNLNDHINEEVDLLPIVNQSIIRAICRISLGTDENRNLSNYINNIQTMLDLTGTKIFSVWKSIDCLYNLTEEGKTFKKCLNSVEYYIENAINSRLVALKSLITDIQSGRVTMESLIKTNQFNKKEFNFLSHLLLTNATNGFLSNEDLKSELITFTLAGNETSSITTTFAAYCLAINPKIQEIAYQEQLSISGGNINKPITFQDIHEMKYLECVIKETMRLFPPIMFFGRRLTKDVTLSDGIELPAECNVLFMPFLTHKMPELFPEPDTFNPERYIIDHPSQYSYFPFSAGPRNCVGGKLGLMDTKFYLASIIRSVELLPPLGERPKLIVNMSLKSSGGVNVRLRNRC